MRAASFSIAVLALGGLAGDAGGETTHSSVHDIVSRTQSVIAAVSSTTTGEDLAIDVEMAGFPAVTTADPLVDLGSITKFVTAVAVLNLVDDGHLDLDTPLSALIDDAPTDKRDITIHQLLSHTSGLIESTGSDEERLDRAAFVARLMEAPLAHAPGEAFLYSNAGYSLLAAIVELTSHQRYEDYLRDALTEPAGLPPIGYQSVFAEERSLVSRRQFLTHFRRLPIDRASWGGTTPGWNLIGNGGAVTTADGFLEFWTAFHSGRLVSPALVGSALTPHADEGDGTSFYGYGLVVERMAAHGMVYWHDGGNDVFSAEWRHIAEDDTTLFVAALGSDAFQVMDELLESMAR